MITRFETGVNGHIANLGHGMHPDHDPEHLRVYLEAIVSFFLKINSKSFILIERFLNKEMSLH